MENPVVTSVTHETLTSVIKLYPLPEGPVVLAELFETLAKRGVVVDIITQSYAEKGQRLAFSVPVDDVSVAKTIISEKLPQAEVEVMDGVSKISIVGVGMRNHPGVAAKFFRVLADNGIGIHLVTTSEIKVSAVIAKDQLNTAAQRLHAAFGLDVEA